MTTAQVGALAGNRCDGQCWDGGALLITALGVGTCPLTQGFWKNHFPGSWPATVLASGLKIGTITYTAAQLEANLERNPSGGNALVILSHQLITALLNQANGSNTASITATITAAQTLIDGLNINTGFVAAGSSLGQQMTALADILDAFTIVRQLVARCSSTIALHPGPIFWLGRFFCRTNQRGRTLGGGVE
jgi:hypothetical protein